MSSERGTFVEHLRTLHTRGGAGNRLVVEAGPSYVVVTGAPGSADLHCEATADDLLPAPPPPARRAALDRLGFQPKRGRRNPARVHPVADERALLALADDALAVLDSAGERGPLRFTLHLGDAETTQNPELIRAMKLLAATRDMAARQRVYAHLLASDLLVALAPGSEGDEDLTPHVFEHLQGYPVIGVFTDWDALRLWEPRGWPYRVIAGRDLFPLAHRGRYGSLLINRRGDVGGELLMNEIEALARAAQRRQG